MAIKVTRHSQLLGQDISTITRWTVQDNPELLALAVTDEDIGKIAFQQDTEQVWFLARSAPTVVWIDLTAEASASPVAVFDEGVEITNDLASTLGLNFVGDGVVVQLSGGFTQVAIPGGGGAGSTFLALADTPGSYGSAGTYIVRVNGAEDALEFVPLTSNLVQIAATPGAEETDLATNSSRILSTGVYSWDGVNDLTGGTFTVGAGTGLIRSGPLETDPIFATKWDEAAAIPLLDQELTYIWVNYNAGAPIVKTGPVQPGNFEDNIILGTIARDGTIYHPTPALVVTSNGFARLSKRFFETELLTHAAGSAITEETSTPLTFSVTAGDWWIALVEIQTANWDGSGADRFFYYWRDGAGGWNFTTGNQQIDNTQYDDGSGTLATLTGSQQRGVHWVYRGVDDHMYVLYGRDSYTSSQAQNAEAPADLPPTFVAGHAALVGKIVIRRDQTAFDSVESPFATKLSVGTITEHNALGGLAEGDDHPQYLLEANIPSLPRTFVPPVNFQPEMTNIDEFYSVAAWQALDDATFSANTSFGTGASPAIPAGHISGIIAPFDCTVEVLDIWGIPASATQETKIAWFKFPLVAGATGGGTAVLVGAEKTLGPSTAGQLVDLTQTISVTLSRGDLLLPVALEKVTAGATAIFGGTVAIREIVTP